MTEDYMKEICANCGLTYGSHHGGTSPWPRNYCPGHEGRMDWENGPGTIFKPKTAKENKVKKPLPTRMIPKAVEEFLQEVKNDHPSLAGPERGGMDFAAKYLLTDPDSPVKKLIEAARPFRGNGDINEALAALELEAENDTESG